MYRHFILVLFLVSHLFSEEPRPLVMKAFDDVNESFNYNRGSYLILLPEGLNEAFLTDDMFLPPLNNGHLTVAFTCSCSLSSTVVLKS